MSVAEIHARLESRRVNVVSVYRAVKLLCGLGLLRVADTSKGTQRFELAEQFTGHHHHLVCQECGGVEDFDGCLLEEEVLANLRQRVRRARSFRLTGHDLKLFGLCRRCAPRRGSFVPHGLSPAMTRRSCRARAVLILGAAAFALLAAGAVWCRPLLLR